MKRKIAVCVGINDYPGVGADLSGCVNDAKDWARVLAERGYEVDVLLDAQTTRANVVQKLYERLASCKFGDRFVFTFSGHGTWMPDRDGDEADQRDEALVCYDYQNGGLLTDDEMHAMFQQRRLGVRVTVLSDSCHSGTVARLMIDPKMSPSPDAKVRFMPPPMFTDISDDEAARIEQTTRNAPSRPGTVLISGCDDHEYSYDASFGGRPNGAMTFFAIQALRNSNGTTKDVYAKLRGYLPTRYYPQTPQLSATYYQKRTAFL